MTKDEISTTLKDIFCDVFERDDVDIKDELCANDIEEWDSLTQIQLIVEIEKAFKIKFTSSEIIKWKNVGEMILAIQNKVK
jgi:acyl carrier protein